MIGVEHIAAWMRRRRAGRRRVNPYIAGTPVFDGRMFFGRESVTRHVLARLESGNVRLIGERRIGKTSFLHHLRGVLASRRGGRRFFPIFVDLESITAPNLLHALLDETVEALAVPEDVRADLRLEAANGRYSPTDFAGDLQRVLDDLHSRTGRPPLLVYLIDEADTVFDRPGPAEPWLASLTGRWKDEVRIVLAAVGRNGSGQEEPRDWRDAFDEIELPPLTEEAAEALVRQPVAGVIGYDAAAVARILELSRLRPYLIQRLCIRSIDRALDEGRSVVWRSDVDAEART
jgi:hypothetical protein